MKKHKKDRTVNNSVETEGEFDPGGDFKIVTSNNNNYKKFKDPIPSYGLMPFYIDRSALQPTVDDILFLAQQRRDTFEYVEFVQGLWDNEEALFPRFSLMCEEEHSRIRNYTIEELWDDMWIDKTSKMYKDGFSRAKKKYDSVYDKLYNMLNIYKPNVLGPPWGFPKGRKNSIFEKDIACACRETEEEARISITLQNCTVLQNYKFPERFQGSNGAFYSTIYYLCEVKTEPVIPDPIQTPLCIRKTSFSEEVQDLRWLPFKEACDLLNQRSQLILREALRTIKNHYNL
jgi:8-oxo-dGTP pyrophosphatase MutT (NUDIX family)